MESLAQSKYVKIFNAKLLVLLVLFLTWPL